MCVDVFSSAMTLSNFTNGSTETMDLRMIDSSRESGSTTTSDYSLSPQRVTDNERGNNCV